MKDKIVVSAIELRQQLGDLLNRAYYQEATIYIKRRGKIIAKLVAEKSPDIVGTKSKANENISILNNSSKTTSTKSHASQEETLKRLKEELDKVSPSDYYNQ